MGNKNNYKTMVGKEHKPHKKPFRIGLADLDGVEQGNYYDLDMWDEMDLSKVLKRAEHILKQCESTTNSCKNELHHISVFSTEMKDKRTIRVSKNGCVLLTTFVASSIYRIDQRGLYYIWPPNKENNGISRYYQIMTPNKRPITKILVLKYSRNLRNRKYIDIIDQFDYVICTDFGREFVYTT